MSAEANSVVDPSTNPNPGPNTRPPRTSRKNTGSMPPVPAPSGRSAAPMADSTPSMASALVSMPRDVSSASTMATSTGSTSGEHERGVALVGEPGRAGR